MSESDQPVIVIVRRHANHEESSHGGAWKIAFADFMTAMMSLFLVLWLISSTSDKTKHTLAQYFNPVKLVDMTTLKKGFHDAKETEMGAGPSAKASPPSAESNRLPLGGKEVLQEGARTKTLSESALFRDPYAALAEIAASGSDEGSSEEASATRSVEAAADPAETFNDPFTNVANTSAPRPPSVSPARPESGSDPAAKMSQSPPASSDPGGPPAIVSVLPREPHPKPLLRPGGAVHEQRREVNVSAQAEASKLSSEILASVRSAASGRDGPAIDVQNTDEGILISMTDEVNFTMFAVGSAQPAPKTIEAMDKVARLLRTHAGPVVIRGHTDARPYRSLSYDNWRLSTARAHMAHYMLARGGLDETRIEKIEGYGDRRLKNVKDPVAAENRRIEILLRKERP